MSLPDNPEELAELSELTGEELMRRGDEMLAAGRRLIIQASELRGLDAADTSQLVEEDYSVGRFGAIRVGEAIAAAQRLGRFSKAQFAQETGLNSLQASRWLLKLQNNKPKPIIVRTGYGSGTNYEYTGPVDEPAPRERPEHASQVEAQAGVGADRAADGRAVAYSGRPLGSSGKPGRDKKISKQRKIKRGKDSFIGGAKK